MSGFRPELNFGKYFKVANPLIKKHPRAYVSWRGMQNRCNNPNTPAFKNYGARGVKICERWSSFSSFVADMGDPPTAAHSLDRINNAGNYEPSNCRWATSLQQNRNSRKIQYITVNGIKACQLDWAREIGVCPATICYWKYTGQLESRIMGILNERALHSAGFFRIHQLEKIWREIRHRRNPKPAKS